MERQDFVNLKEGRSEWVWDQGGVEIWMCGTGKGSGSGTRGSEVGVCVRSLVPIYTSAVF